VEQPSSQDQEFQKQKSVPEQKIPEVIPIDITLETYEQMKKNILGKQHAIVRPHVFEFFKWLKGLNALDVYDALEEKKTVKDRYEEMRFNPIRISVAAARGLLKASPRLRSKAREAFNVDVARLVVRFENPPVWEVLREFDPAEQYLKSNIEAAKEMFGLVEVEKK